MTESVSCAIMLHVEKREVPCAEMEDNMRAKKHISVSKPHIYAFKPHIYASKPHIYASKRHLYASDKRAESPTDDDMVNYHSK